MKQILQNLRNGETQIADVPAPASRSGHLTIRTKNTLVSVGTEKMLVEFGKGNLWQKAMQQPDKVRQVLDKMKTDGVVSTLTTVKHKLETPLPLGYCNVGIISEVGAGVTGFAVGDRVVSNGYHAESVVVPKNLCAKIPDAVDDETAAFTVLGAIALQGIRLLQPTIGETFVVTGLGIIGLLAVQILRANGCQVIGLDFDARRRELAREMGAEVIDLSADGDPVSFAHAFTEGVGVDGVLLTASTPSNEPISQAAKMCRKRGRVVLVGVVGLEISRADFYEKEITFQVSCSYGPGRYDAEYETKGKDYPIGFVRWTQARNFAAVLSLMAAGRIRVKHLITHRYAIEEAATAYAELKQSGALGILLEYPRWERLEVQEQTVHLTAVPPSSAGSRVFLGVLGAGNYAGAVLLPEFARTAAVLAAVSAHGGISSAHLGKKFGFAKATSDNQQILDDEQINTLVIATRHDTHAELVEQAVVRGKNVYVEKPLAITFAELQRLQDIFTQSPHLPLIMVGFNRRYSPHVQKIKSLLHVHKGVCAMVMTINAGHIDPAHWTQDRKTGGGRIIGEVCHFVDLLRFLAGSPIVDVKAVYLDTATRDSVIIALRFANGTIASINYFSNGNKSFPKERLEVFAGGGILQLENFRKTTGFRWPGFNSMKTFKQDKGQRECVQSFVKAVEEGNPAGLIPLAEVLEVTRVCLMVEEQLDS